MSLSDEFESYVPVRPGQRCRTCMTLVMLLEADRSEGEAFASMLSDRVRFSDRTIQEILDRHGYKLSASSIRLHRQKCGSSGEPEA